jgi:hypothetical protein
MPQIILDASLSGRLHQMGQPAELCDPDGKVIGRFVPIVNLALWEPVTPEVSEEELDRREQADDWVSSEEVRAHLKSLEKP